MELELTERPRIDIESAHEALLDIYDLRLPAYRDIETDPTLSRLSDEGKAQVFALLTQAIIEESQITQKLSHIVYTHGEARDDLGQCSISSPNFLITLYPRRVEDHTHLAVPSMLHTQLDGYFGASLHLFSDYSLDTSKAMIFSWHGKDSYQNAGIILPIVAARIAYSLGVPLDGPRTIHTIEPVD